MTVRFTPDDAVKAPAITAAVHPQALCSTQLGASVTVLQIDRVTAGQMPETASSYFHFRLTNGLEALKQGQVASGGFLIAFREPPDHFDSYYTGSEYCAELLA